MSWGLAKFVGGLVLGSILIALFAKLRLFLRVKEESAEETDAYIHVIKDREDKRVDALTPEEFLKEWDQAVKEDQA